MGTTWGEGHLQQRTRKAQQIPETKSDCTNARLPEVPKPAAVTQNQLWVATAAVCGPVKVATGTNRAGWLGRAGTRKNNTSPKWAMGGVGGEKMARARKQGQAKSAKSSALALENEEDTELSPDSDVTAERNLPQTGGRAQPDKVLKALRRESAGDSTLSKYFTEMAQHRVLSPQEEVEAAKEVQRLETDYWVVLFSYLPAFETVAAVVERSLEQPLEEVAALRELSVGAKDNGQKLKKGETTKWKKVSGELSAKP